MANQGQSTRLDTALKLLLITFVSLVAFFTGAYVGKAMSDSDHQLKAMEADFQTQKTAAEKHKDLDVADKDALVDEEVAQMSDKIMKTEKDQLGESEVKETAEAKVGEKTEVKTADAKAPVKANEPETKTLVKAVKPTKQTREVAAEEKPIKKITAHVVEEPSLSVKKSKLDLSEVHKTAERIAKNEVATSDEQVSQKPEANSRIPSSLPKSVGTASGPGFTVQVASFPTSDEAKKQVDELVKKGFPAFPIEATISGKTWYRVSLGNFKTQKEAAQYRIQLIKDSDIKKAIVAKVSPN